LMERSGCYSMAFGIESGSDRILEMMRKGISVHQIRQKIRLVSETTKIKMTGFFMVGFPDEKREDIKKTEELILGERLHRILVAPFIPYPATPLYKELVEKERIPERCLGGLHVLYDERVFVPGSLSAKQLFRAARKMQLKFYLRPKIMIGILSELRSFEQLKVALRMFFFWLGFVRIRKHEISNRGA
jgi:anaerobic magnesium-protoporphyrin IX monomethyl ester cyclase